MNDIMSCHKLYVIFFDFTHYPCFESCSDQIVSFDSDIIGEGLGWLGQYLNISFENSDSFMVVSENCHMSSFIFEDLTLLAAMVTAYDDHCLSLFKLFLNICRNLINDQIFNFFIETANRNHSFMCVLNVSVGTFELTQYDLYQIVASNS